MPSYVKPQSQVATGHQPVFKIRGRMGEKGINTRASLGSCTFATDRKMCELPVTFSTLLNAAEYVVTDFNKRCPSWSGRAAVKWLKPVISSLTNKSPRSSSNENDSNAHVWETRISWRNLWETSTAHMHSSWQMPVFDLKTDIGVVTTPP